MNPIVRNAKAKVDASIGVNLNSMKWQWNPDFWSHFCQQNWESFLSCFASPIVVYVVKFKNARRELKSSGTFVRNRWLDNWPWAYNGAQQQRLEHWHENWLSAALIDTPSCLREVFVVASSSAAILVPRSRAIETVNYLTDIEFLDLLKQASILANQYTVQHCIISATPTHSADERSERIRKDINLILHWRHNSKEGSEGKKKKSRHHLDLLSMLASARLISWFYREMCGASIWFWLMWNTMRRKNYFLLLFMSNSSNSQFVNIIVSFQLSIQYNSATLIAVKKVISQHFVCRLEVQTSFVVTPIQVWYMYVILNHLYRYFMSWSIPIKKSEEFSFNLITMYLYNVVHANNR